jgi:mono/diheme cytochrome c family protein
MQTPPNDFGDDEAASLSLYLDDAKEPFATYRPPATVEIDTTLLEDGSHMLHIRARDSVGNTGVRSIPFVVQNGPGITVTGLRANERVRGTVELDLNAFGSSEPFDSIRAESSGPIPVWTWVMMVLVAAWAGWYGLTEFQEPAAFASGVTNNPLAAANAPMANATRTAYSGHGTAGGFDYAATGAQLYATNCAACHGAGGAGVPGAFPALAADPIVTNANPQFQIAIVLHGLHGKIINRSSYSAQMPTFSQLSDSDIAAIIDHERTSWGNAAPTINPDDIKRARGPETR